MIKKILTMFTCMGLLASFSFADETAQQMSDDKTLAGCSLFKLDEQIFAKKLSETNKKMFCDGFSSTQRAQAMDMASQTDEQGQKVMTPDQAVMKVAQDNSMTSPAMTSSDCSALNADEKAFAKKLSQANKKVFCNELTASQRAEAMDRAKRTSSKGAKTMTPDQAVMSVAVGEDTMSSNSMSSDCSSLTMKEQQFANKLSNSNRMMFCNQFDSSQRADAMDMANETDTWGAKMMTPDQAVMQVAQDNGMM
jgi:hypothetical protein